MGLRKLTNKPASVEGTVPSERVDRETASRRYQSEAEAHGASTHAETTDVLSESLSASVGTELQTPPPSHREFADFESEHPSVAATPKVAESAPPAAPAVSEAPTAAASESIDPFVAALDALRSTLRQSSVVLQPAAPEPVVESKAAEAPAVIEPLPPAAVIAPPAVLEEVASESASALEQVPLPTSADAFVPVDRGMYKDSPAIERRKQLTPKPAAPREAATIDTALQAVRDAVPGLNLTPPKSDTPTVSRKQPSSDGIPKSVSEDLPKYPARPKMRTCTRCGHETKLRDAKCQKCSHVDESLGILDAVIAGDLTRVEQVLLVRPHLITLRTSRHDWTLLHMAASGGNPKMVELLIEKGASVNSVNRDGKTALHYAAGKGHAGIVKILLRHLADATALYNGRSALDLARKNGHREVEDLLREQRPAD